MNIIKIGHCAASQQSGFKLTQTVAARSLDIALEHARQVIFKNEVARGRAVVGDVIEANVSTERVKALNIKCI